MEFKPLLLKYQIYLMPAIVGLISILIITLVIVPQSLGYFTVQEQISQIEQKKASVEAKVDELENVNEGLYLKNLQLTYNALPKDKEIPESMLVLQNLVTEAGLNLDSIKILGIIAGASGSSYQLNIGVSGTLSLLKEFFLKLPSSPRIFKVENYSVQLAGSVVEADIVLTTFFDQTTVKTAPADVELPKLTDNERKILSKLAQIPQYIQRREDESGAVELGKTDPFK